MKVCLIYPRTITLKSFFPLGIGYVASVLEREGHDVSILDVEERDNFWRDLEKINPDLVGLSVTTPAINLSKFFISRIKQLLPNVPIVCGGIHPSFFKEAFIEETGTDFISVGESENTIVELCRNLETKNKDFSQIKGLIYRDNDRVISNPRRPLIENLDNIPLPARHKVDFNSYLLPPGVIRGVWLERSTNMMTSRGCIGDCFYCGSKFLFERRIRRRSVDNVIAEIELLADSYNIDGLFIIDDTFLINKKWIEEFVEKFRQKKFGIKWTCYGRVDTVSEDLLRLAKQGGCIQVEYGVESCSNRILSYIKKGTNINKIKKAFEMSRKLNLRTLGCFMMGFPTETEEDVNETIRIAKTLKADMSVAFYATPYPGTEFYDIATRENRILEKDFSKWYIRDSSIYRADIPQERLQYLHAKFMKAVRLQNTYFFVKNYKYLFKLLLLVLKEPRAFYLALKDTIIRYKCFDEFPYAFLSYAQGGKK